MTWCRAPLLLAIVVAVGACSAGGPRAEPASPPTQSVEAGGDVAPAPSPSPQPQPELTYDATCREAALLAADVLTDPALGMLPPASSLRSEQLDARLPDGTVAVEPWLDWRVTDNVRHDDELVLVRELHPGELERAAEGWTHTTVSIGTSGQDAAWSVVGGGSCVPERLVPEGRNGADLRLASEPGPQDRQLQLLVGERACTSGQGAEGRILLDELDVTDSQVGVAVSVVPLATSGDDVAFSCEGFAMTPFTVSLDEPVGDRTVVDASRLPALPLGLGDLAPGGFPRDEDRTRTLARLASYRQPPDHTLWVAPQCRCPEGPYMVHVRDGAVVARTPARPSKATALDDPGPGWAPSLPELVERIQRAAAGDTSEVLVDLFVGPGGGLQLVRLDPDPETGDDTITFSVRLELDAPHAALRER